MAFSDKGKRENHLLLLFSRRLRVATIGNRKFSPLYSLKYNHNISKSRTIPKVEIVITTGKTVSRRTSTIVVERKRRGAASTMVITIRDPSREATAAPTWPVLRTSVRSPQDPEIFWPTASADGYDIYQ